MKINVFVFPGVQFMKNSTDKEAPQLDNYLVSKKDNEKDNEKEYYRIRKWGEDILNHIENNKDDVDFITNNYHFPFLESAAKEFSNKYNSLENADIHWTLFPIDQAGTSASIAHIARDTVGVAKIEEIWLSGEGYET